MSNFKGIFSILALLTFLAFIPTVTYGQKAQTQQQQRQPYQMGGVVLWSCSEQMAERTFTVPEGKRFIIENVAYRSFPLDPGDGIRAEIWTTFEGSLRPRPLDFHRQQFGDSGWFVAAHPLLAFADAGTEVSIRAFLSDPTGVSCSSPGSPPIMSGAISGYLVDMP